MLVETEFDKANLIGPDKKVIVKMPLRSRIIEKDEYESLLGLYNDISKYSLIWRILWETGMRPIEVCWLQLDNIDLKRKRIGYKIGKPIRKKTADGKIIDIYKSRVVPISDNLRDRLQRYIDLNKGRFLYYFLFPSYDNERKEPYMTPRSLNKEMSRVRKILRGRFLDRGNSHYLIGPHSFRRSWIVRYLDKNHNPAECARAIGHSSIDVTFGYYQDIKEENLRSFVDSQVVDVSSNISSDQSRLTSFMSG